MSWRPRLEDRALRQMQGLPTEAFDMLVRTLARICDEPYDPVFSAPVPPVPGRRVADLGDFGSSGYVELETKAHLREPAFGDTEPPYLVLGRQIAHFPSRSARDGSHVLLI